jgi:hypothetical protein
MAIPSSPEYQEAERRYAHAIQAERSAWEVARNRLPGTESFDSQAWGEWQRCVGTSNAARSALLALIQVTSVAGAHPRAPEARPGAAA